MEDKCECGHSLEDHDFSDYGNGSYEELGCTRCKCSCYMEEEDDNS